VCLNLHVSPRKARHEELIHNVECTFHEDQSFSFETFFSMVIVTETQLKVIYSLLFNFCIVSSFTIGELYERYMNIICIKMNLGYLLECGLIHMAEDVCPRRDLVIAVMKFYCFRKSKGIHGRLERPLGAQQEPCSTELDISGRLG
jgi:hypothetical protein